MGGYESQTQNRNTKAPLEIPLVLTGSTTWALSKTLKFDDIIGWILNLLYLPKVRTVSIAIPQLQWNVESSVRGLLVDHLY